MNNHGNTNSLIVKNNDKKDLINTIFMKGEPYVKKRVSKKSNDDNPIKKSLPTDDNSTTHKQKTQTYNIDSLSDSNGTDDEEIINEDQSHIVLSLQDILNSIPESATRTPSFELQQTHTEWRWRFFDLRERKLIEISKMEPKLKRIYMDNQGKWTEYTLKKEWDNFMVDIRFCYVQK
jgi:hypothetical protein